MLFLEVLAVTALLLVLLRGLMYISWGPIHEYSSVIFLVLAVYLPIFVLRAQNRSIDFVERSIGAVVGACGTFIVVALVIFPPYFLAAHVWQTIVGGLTLRPPLQFWPGWNLIIAQIVLVALPEEFFFRGYVQSTFDKIFSPRWKLFGVKLGWSWLLTAVLFAVAHSVIMYQWWHFAIFFPALAFGYLRARTGGLLAPILFHATSNLAMWWLGVNYQGTAPGL